MSEQIGAVMKLGQVVTNVNEAYEAGYQAGQMGSNSEYSELIKRNSQLQEQLLRAHESINHLIHTYCKR